MPKIVCWPMLFSFSHIGLAERFGEYPKLKDLIQLKDELIRKTNTPPTYLKRDLKTFNLSELG